MPDDDRLMTLAEVCEHLGISIHTGYAWRQRGYGPPGAKVGQAVRFRRADVDAWFDEQRDRTPAA